MMLRPASVGAMLALLRRGSAYLSMAPALPAPRAGAHAPATPESPAIALLRRGRDLLDGRDTAAALACFDAAAQLDPSLSMAHLCRALCLSALGRDEEASAALALALGTGREHAPARVHFARMCAGSGNLPLALEILGPAVAADPARAQSVLEDDGFAPLRDDPRFLQIVGAL